jgi:hypothetical protein
MVMRFTDEVKAKCAEREARIRREVYPNRVYTKRMSQQLADREIAIMDEIAAEYRAKCRTLFDGPDLVHAAGSADRKAEEV